MNVIDNSNHICLICSTTIVGLLQYVEHYKSHAIPQDVSFQQEQKPFLIPHLKNEEQTAHSGGSYDNTVELSKQNPAELSSQCLSHTSSSHEYFNENSPLSAFANQDFPDPDIETDALLSPKYNIDFFQSLELKSTNEETAPVTKPKLKATQRLSILEDDMHAENLLPITSILSNIDFSSDDEDEAGVTNISNNDNQYRNWSDDDDETGNLTRTHPPRTHTGGKWKPGQGPGKKKSSTTSSAGIHKKLPIAGKWKPGNYISGPAPASHKAVMRNNKKTQRRLKTSAESELQCNVCEDSFSDRLTYSLHFGEQKHKNTVAERRLSKARIEKTPEAPEEAGMVIMTEAGVAEAVVAGAINEDALPKVQDITANVDTAVTAQNRDEEQYHCPTCDLYFCSSFVFQTHCETKVHKDNLLKDGYKEYRSSDGVIIRIDVRTDAVFTDRQENQLLAARQPKKLGPTTSNVDEKHECVVCRKVFKRKYEMARHLLTRMHRVRAQSKPMDIWVEMLDKYNKYMTRLCLFQCGICQFYFNRQHDFLDHMCSPLHLKYCADMLGPIMCVACKYKTHKHAEMMVHLQTMEHYTTVERCHGMCILRESHTSITCKFCGITMHSAARIKRHCQLRHANRLIDVLEMMDVKPTEHAQYQCPICEKVFKVKTLLQFHFLRFHKQKSVFTCTICDRGFLDQRRLDNHLRTPFHARKVITAKLKDRREKFQIKKKQIRQMNRDKKADGKKNKGKKEAKSDLKTQDDDDDNCVSDKENDVDDSRDNETLQDNVATTATQDNEREKMDDDIQTNDREMGNVDSGRNVRRSSRKRKRVRFPDEKSNSESDVDEAELIFGLKLTDRLSEKSGKIRQYLMRDLPQEEVSDYVERGPELTEKEKEILDKMSYVKNIRKGKGRKKEEAEELDEDVLEEASKRVFTCTYCEYSASDLLELRSHYNESHPCDILSCQPCNQFFLSLKAFKIHCAGRGHQLKLREETGETEIHACPLCDKRFLKASFCAFHVETVHRHPNSEADLQLIHKGKDLVTQLYGDHVAQVEKLSNDTSVSCPECGKFVRKDNLREHLRLHTGEKPYSCRFCHKSFAGRLTLRRHISTHLDMPLFVCDLCGKEFKRNNHLVKHMRQHDNEKKGVKHTCEVCKVWFYTEQELERHKKRHGKRSYQCTWPGCQWLFVNPSELKSHMHTHTRERTYLCDQCGYGAPTKTRLKRHAKTHQNIRPFACDYCPYKASLKTHLVRHMRIHINSKPYACPYCKFTCNTHENIRKHILKTKKHKGKKLYPCKLCSDFGCDTSSEFKGHLMTVHAEYLRENAVDSLAVFSGLYKKEEDFTKPKEGSEIRQVTKGRFFRNYTNPNAPPLDEKLFHAKKIRKKANTSPTPKVVVVSREEMQAQALKSTQQHQQQHQQQQQQQQQQGKIVNELHSDLRNSRTHSVIITPHQNEPAIPLHQGNPGRNNLTTPTPEEMQLELDCTNVDLEMTVKNEGTSAESAIDISQYVEIPNAIIQESLNVATDVGNNINNARHIFPVTFTISSQFDDQLQQHQLQQQQQQQHEDELQLQQHLQQIRQQQQQERQQSSGSDNRVFWVEAATATDSQTLVAAVNNTSLAAHASSNSPTHQHHHQEPWYSGIPQVHHASSCHDIANLASTLEVENDGISMSAGGSQNVPTAATVAEYLPDKYFNVTATQIYNVVAGNNKVVVLDQTASDL